MQLQGADKVFNLPSLLGYPPLGIPPQSESEEGSVGFRGCRGSEGPVLRRDYQHREMESARGGLQGRLVRKWETDPWN